MRDMTHLGEPQSAAGVPALVPDHQADQPRLAGMGELLKKGLGKTGDHMNVPVDVASLVQQPAKVAGLRPAQGGSWGEQMGTVYLIGFDYDRRVLREHTASSTQDAPGSMELRTWAVSENTSPDATVFSPFTPFLASIMQSFIGRLEDRHSLLQH
jgi:hypothetical protein